MLGKLLKHELRATARVMLPLSAALLAVSVMANFSFRSLERPGVSNFVNVISTIIVILFAVGIVAVCIMAVVLMIQRFRSNLLQDEGYIMFTLPASVHSIVWSKIIVSAIWFAVTFAVVVASGLISVMQVSYISEFVRFIKEVFSMVNAEYALDATTMIIEIIVLAFLGCTAISVTFYAALSTGHGFANRKMLLSIVAFFVFTIATEVLIGLVCSLFDTFDLSLPFYNLVHTGMAEWHLDFAYSALGMIIYSAVFYFITVYALKKHLNLE